MAQLYADENFPLPVVKFLRELGHNVLTIQEDGKANQRYPDELVLSDAVSHKRAILTLNRKHFKQLHSSGVNHYGLLLCSFDPDFMGQANRIHQAIESKDNLKSTIIQIYRA